MRFVVTRSSSLSSQKRAEQQGVEAEVIRKLKQKQRCKDDGHRKKLEKYIEELVARGNVTTEQLQELAPKVPIQSQNTILTLFNNPAAAVGTVFLHTWFDEIKHKKNYADAVFQGTIIKLKQKESENFHGCIP